MRETESAPPAAPATIAHALQLTNPLTSGADVTLAQELLTQNPFMNFQPGSIDGEYGPATAQAVRRAKFTLGYPDEKIDTVCGPALVGYLQGTPLPPDYQQRSLERASSVGQQSALRQAIVGFARWGIANEQQIHYQQLRPIDGLAAPSQLPLRTDCSGFVTLCYKWAGAPDPNGLGFNGQGYTGTILKACHQIAQSAAQPGDLVVWGAPPGKHVALLLEQVADPILCTHGQEKGPAAVSFSAENTYQKTPATWLTCLP